VILILGTFTVDPARVDEARAAMDAMIAASRAEDGCLEYGYAPDLAEPGLFHVIERWRDRAAFDGHVAAPHLAAWRAQWKPLGISGRELKLYEADEGTPL
jgi:quinol monooxygenase YgiN